MNTKDMNVIGSHDAGHSSPPGGSIACREVTFYRDGKKFAVGIDTHYGSNQGFFRTDGGETVEFFGKSLADVSELAIAHIEDMGNVEDKRLLRIAHRIALNNAMMADDE